MKDTTLIVILVGGFALLFWAFSKGFISSGAVPIGPGGKVQGGILAPQPAQNYGGFLAASTAPGVSTALNGLLTGLGGGLSSWLNPPKPAAPAPSPSGPAAPATPAGNASAQLSGYNATPYPYVPALGPIIDPSMAYDNTNMLDFGYDSLAADNAYTPADSLTVA